MSEITKYTRDHIEWYFRLADRDLLWGDKYVDHFVKVFNQLVYAEQFTEAKIWARVCNIQVRQDYLDLINHGAPINKDLNGYSELNQWSGEPANE